MTHRYGIPVPVEQDKHTGWPRSFVWHGEMYEITEVISTWHLLDRWWDRGDPFALPGYSDRTYYRVRCPDQQFFDLYHDVANNVWVLDRAHD